VELGAASMLEAACQLEGLVREALGVVEAALEARPSPW
jgi:hypothetical protein